MLIDPKMVELAPFNHIPHLVSPVIYRCKGGNIFALKWAVEEMGVAINYSLMQVHVILHVLMP